MADFYFIWYGKYTLSFLKARDFSPSSQAPFRHPRASEFICEARNERDTGIQENYYAKRANLIRNYSDLDSGSQISLLTQWKSLSGMTGKLPLPFKKKIPEEHNDSSRNGDISYIKHWKILYADKICHRAKNCTLKSIEKSSSHNHEITGFFHFRDFIPWLPEKNSDTEKYEWDNKWNTRQRSAKSNTSIFDMSDAEDISYHRKFWIWSIYPVFCEDIS